jgi:hypothetical protein
LRGAVVEDLPSLLALFDSQESVGLSKEQEKSNPLRGAGCGTGCKCLSVVFSVHHCNFITAKVGAKKKQCKINSITRVQRKIHSTIRHKHKYTCDNNTSTGQRGYKRLSMFVIY